jgi:hypothetical protein
MLKVGEKSQFKHKKVHVRDVKFRVDDKKIEVRIESSINVFNKTNRSSYT